MAKNILLPVALVVVIVAAVAVVMTRTGSPSSSTVASNQAVISNVAVTSPNTASAGQAGTKVIRWSTEKFPANGLVTINLLGKTSSQPSSFVLIRTIAEDTANDGEYSWTPIAGEKNTYIEVICSKKTEFANGCQVSGQPVKAD